MQLTEDSSLAFGNLLYSKAAAENKVIMKLFELSRLQVKMVIPGCRPSGCVVHTLTEISITQLTVL